MTELQEIKIRLSRLEDELVGYMNVHDTTTIDHMVRRIEYAHEAVSEILRYIIQCQKI